MWKEGGACRIQVACARAAVEADTLARSETEDGGEDNQMENNKQNSKGVQIKHNVWMHIDAIRNRCYESTTLRGQEEHMMSP